MTIQRVSLQTTIQAERSLHAAKQLSFCSVWQSCHACFSVWVVHYIAHYIVVELMKTLQCIIVSVDNFSNMQLRLRNGITFDAIIDVRHMAFQCRLAIMLITQRLCSSSGPWRLYPSQGQHADHDDQCLPAHKEVIIIAQGTWQPCSYKPERPSCEPHEFLVCTASARCVATSTLAICSDLHEPTSGKTFQSCYPYLPIAIICSAEPFGREPLTSRQPACEV